MTRRTPSERPGAPVVPGKRKPGRPPLPPGERRSAPLVLDLKPAELDAVKALAVADGKPYAVWARDAVLDTVARRLAKRIVTTG